jgi:hypothetical protein
VRPLVPVRDNVMQPTRQHVAITAAAAKRVNGLRYCQSATLCSTDSVYLCMQHEHAACEALQGTAKLHYDHVNQHRAVCVDPLFPIP